MKIRKRIYLILLLAVAALQMNAAPVSLKAKLDSVQILMGKMTLLHLEAVQDKGKPGGLPMFSQIPPDGVICICGDSVELRTSFARDTVDLGSNRIQINYSIPVQAFDSGYYRLPKFIYVSGKDTAYSNQVALKVIPVPIGANEQISDYTGPVKPDGSIFDTLPDWVIDLWWLWVSIIILTVLFIFAMKRYRERGSLLPPKPEPSPYDVAMRRLVNLKGRHLWEQGMEKEYFTLLTDILREYLDRRFGINAMEMTTSQIIDSLADNAEAKQNRGYMRDILDMADYVKFAKVRPLPDDNIAAFANAEKFIEETKPAPVAEESDSDKEQTPAEGTEKKGGDK